ncbi:MAG: hypothetical protein KC492_27640 [Myxococcales bacterium]|nr:hypothetical protein [Myxococcales bacterium]
MKPSSAFAALLGTLAVSALAPSVSAQRATELATGSNYGIQVEIEATDESPTRDDAFAPAVSVFREVPSIVRLTVGGETQISLSKTSTKTTKLNVRTNGSSKCVEVYAHAKGEPPLPLQFAIVKDGDRDPCTGLPPAGDILDYTTGTSVDPKAQRVGRRHWALLCEDGCHWVRLRVRRNQGID